MRYRTREGKKGTPITAKEMLEAYDKAEKKSLTQKEIYNMMLRAQGNKQQQELKNLTRLFNSTS